MTAFKKIGNRKSEILAVLASLLLCVFALNSPAQTLLQTNGTVQAVQGVGTTIGGWFTSENPANRFQDAEFWTGAINQNNATIANETGASLDLWRQHPDYFPYTGTNANNSSLFLDVDGRLRMAGIGGTFLSAGAGPGFGWMQNDVRVGIFAEPVYRFNVAGSPSKAHLRGEFGLFGAKMLTPNTAAGLVLSWQTGEKSPYIGGQLNVSFGNGHGFFGLFGNLNK